MTRLRVVGAAICLALLLLISRLFWMQVMHGEAYRQEAFKRIQQEKVLNPKRGQIFDRHGRLLVRNRLSHDVLLIPSKLDEGVLERLALLLELPRKEIDQRYARVCEEVGRWVESDLKRRFKNASASRQRRARRSLTRYFNKRAYLLVENVSDMDRLQEIFVNPRQYAGLLVSARPGRMYPQGDSCCHILGYMGRIWSEEFGQLRIQGYQQNDRLGRTGLEKRYEPSLRGSRGVQVRGRRIGGGAPKLLYQKLPVNGRDLKTTLDLTLQQAAERALDGRLRELAETAAANGRPEAAPPGAAAVVLSVRTGEVLALASAPRYEPGRFSELFAQLRQDKARWPLINRAIRGHRVPPPGSVFKILTAIAGLEEGKITPSTAFNCKGYLYKPEEFRCWNTRGHGPMALAEAIEQSCNVYFYHVGELLGGDKLGAWGRAFGFGSKTGIELSRESAGIMPSPAWKWDKLGRQWYKADSRFTAIGQGMLSTTPLQVARFMAAVATRGGLARVRLLARTPGKFKQIDLPNWIWDAVQGGMRKVVEGRRGTASRYDLARFKLAAKTGTAEMGGKLETHAWLAGYAPYDNPEIAIVVLVEHSGHGGEVCGPVARKILDAYFSRR